MFGVYSEPMKLHAGNIYLSIYLIIQSDYESFNRRYQRVALIPHPPSSSLTISLFLEST